MKTELSTKNLIIKTLVVLVIFSLFLVSCCMVFLPAKVADVSASLGMEKMSIAFEKVSYEKTGDINTLATILNYEIYQDNTEEIAQYGMEMLNHQYYQEYVEFLGVNSLTSMSYNVYCETYIMRALYLEGMEDEAIAVLSNSISTGYQSFGGGILLCSEVCSAGDADFANKMLEVYQNNISGASDIKAYNITLEALMLTEDLLQSEYEFWAETLADLNDKFAD